jgi:hypothetical protein
MIMTSMTAHRATLPLARSGAAHASRRRVQVENPTVPGTRVPRAGLQPRTPAKVVAPAPVTTASTSGLHAWSQPV